MPSTVTRTLFSTFVILISIIYQLANAQSLSVASVSSTAFTLESTTTSTPSVSTSSTTTTLNSSLSNTNTTGNPSPSTSNLINTRSSSLDTTISATESNAKNTSTSSYSPRSGPGLWLLAALLVTIVIVIVAGILFYRHQSSPYRRFLQNWRSRDDDTDNIILQLEQTDSSRNPWPPRISFT